MARLAFTTLVVLVAGACGDDDGPAGPREGPLPFDAAIITRGDAAVDDGDGGLVNGCSRLLDPQAMPGDRIDGDDFDTFATPFFEAYCTRCHSTANVGMMRNGAPAGRNWDDPASVRMFLAEMRLWVGEINAMPLGEPKPSCEERQRLVRWIDAGAP